MTNEEMVLNIKAGDKSLIAELWNQNKGFAGLKAHDFYSKKVDRLRKMGYEKADLLQEAYFALLRAIGYYDKDSKYRFITFFNMCLKAQFYELAGLHTKKDSLQIGSISLDATCWSDKDGDEVSLIDIIPDPFGEEALFTVDEADYKHRLHADLEKAVSNLDERQEHIIRQYYYCGSTDSSIAGELGVSSTSIRRSRQKALKRLSYDQALSAYRFTQAKNRLIEQNSLAYKGEQSRFKYSRISLQERYVERLEELEKKYKQCEVALTE